VADKTPFIDQPVELYLSGFFVVPTPDWRGFAEDGFQQVGESPELNVPETLPTLRQIFGSSIVLFQEKGVPKLCPRGIKAVQSPS